MKCLFSVTGNKTGFPFFFSQCEKKRKKQEERKWPLEKKCKEVRKKAKKAKKKEKRGKDEFFGKFSKKIPTIYLGSEGLSEAKNKIKSEKSTPWCLFGADFVTVKKAKMLTKRKQKKTNLFSRFTAKITETLDTDTGY